MPTYANSNTRSVTLRGGVSLKKYKTLRKNTTAAVEFYPTSLPDNVTFVSHSPLVYPFRELASVTEYPSDTIAVTGYATLIFYNRTGDVVTFYANGNDDDVLSVPSGVYLTVELDGKWGSVVFVSGGSPGNIKLWGI
jgi:hypothetical protein